MRLEMQHEDEPNELVFEDEEVDNLENYDYENDDEGEDHFLEDLSEDVESLIDRCCYPYANAEPELEDEALRELDVLADHIEISRLVGLGVLISPDSVGESPKRLSTKFVRTWRCKTRHNVKVWLRRARYVAREFTWMSPERQDLFSPASSSIITRILPYCFLKQSTMPGSDVCMASLDITDAFLTVDQEVPTIVDCNGTFYGLGKVLPGQRDGSQLWYKSITQYLQSRLGIEPLEACPCLLRRPDLSLVMLMHVDDLLLVGSRRFIEQEVVPTLLERYKVSLEILQKPNDELEFLKRKHRLIAVGQMAIFPHSKHFEKLFELVGVKKTWRPKNVPGHGMINEFDETMELDAAKATKFRSGVGILLYLAHDLIECQFVIRGLARHMSKPTERAWDILKYLVQYLLGRVEHGLLMKLEENHTSNDIDLLVYSDSDWAGHKGSRKFASSCFVKVDGVLLHSSSRTQGIIALSSGEAECYASVSSSCDGIYLSRCLQFCSGLEVKIKLLLDSSSARQILSRAGVGRIRHLSVKVLWLQQKVEAKEIHVGAVGTVDNIADLGTKRLNCNTTRYLMYLCGVFDGSELVGKEEFEQMQRKRMVNRLACNQNLLQVNQRILQLALMMQLPQVVNGLSGFHFDISNALSPQFVVFGAMEWLHVAMVILGIAALMMAACYKSLWQSEVADNVCQLETLKTGGMKLPRTVSWILAMAAGLPVGSSQTIDGGEQRGDFIQYSYFGDWTPFLVLLAMMMSFLLLMARAGRGRSHDEMEENMMDEESGSRYGTVSNPRIPAEEAARRPRRLPVPSFREQLLRCLALTGEMFATIVEGTQYERDVHLRWQGREAADAARASYGTSLFQLELITRALVDSRLEPAQECLLLAGSDEQNPMILVRGIDHLRQLYPEVVQQEAQQHGRYLFSVHGGYVEERGYNVALIRETLGIADNNNEEEPAEAASEMEPEAEDQAGEHSNSSESSSDRFTVENAEDRRIRYLNFPMEEVSDPEMWMRLNHGGGSCSSVEEETSE